MSASQGTIQDLLMRCFLDVCGCFLVGLEKISEPRGLKVRGTGLLLGVVYLGIRLSAVSAGQS